MIEYFSFQQAYQTRGAELLQRYPQLKSGDMSDEQAMHIAVLAAQLDSATKNYAGRYDKTWFTSGRINTVAQRLVSALEAPGLKRTAAQEQLYRFAQAKRALYAYQTRDTYNTYRTILNAGNATIGFIASPLIIAGALLAGAAGVLAAPFVLRAEGEEIPYAETAKLGALVALSCTTMPFRAFKIPVDIVSQSYLKASQDANEAAREPALEGVFESFRLIDPLVWGEFGVRRGELERQMRG